MRISVADTWIGFVIIFATFSICFLDFCSLLNLFLGFLQPFQSVFRNFATFAICFWDFYNLRQSVSGIIATFSICFLVFYNLCNLFLGFLKPLQSVSWLLVQLVRHLLLVNSRPKPLFVIQISSNIQSWFNRAQNS